VSQYRGGGWTLQRGGSKERRIRPVMSALAFLPASSLFFRFRFSSLFLLSFSFFDIDIDIDIDIDS
jgi:hypothetical protein